jgi:hypothetical protein
MGPEEIRAARRDGSKIATCLLDVKGLRLPRQQFYKKILTRAESASFIAGTKGEMRFRVSELTKIQFRALLVAARLDVKARN